jgi:peptidyl-prolyl cis-trans isomerase A (cyclophilin A)
MRGIMMNFRISVSVAAAVVSAAFAVTVSAQNAAAPAAAKPAGAASLTDPSKLNEKAPESFKVKFETTVGAFTVEVSRALSPNGADRFYNMVKNGFFRDIAFFRAIEGFMCQFGIHGDPKIAAVWRAANIPDDAVKASNTRGMITFAKTGAPNSRSTQFFINLADNANLDDMGFSPFGKVTEGMETIDKIYKGYGEGAPRGNGPDQMRAQAEGNAYFRKDFPKLDYIKSAEVLK